MAKPVLVSACRHDGSDDQVALVLDWVGRVGSSQVRARAEFGSVVVIEQPWPAEPVRLAPGMFLVLFEGEWGGWAVYSADQFVTAFEPRPRELPIFNDGEVA